MTDPITTHIFAHGKLLISAEYFVMDGAKALALPTRLGQSMQIEETEGDGILHWYSIDSAGNEWLKASFSFIDFVCTDSDSSEAITLTKILKACRNLNPNFLLERQESIKLSTKLDFPRDWGLGSSSTLIYLLAKWANVNPYQLLEMSFGGSGYDIACAGMNEPLYYTKNGYEPLIEPVKFNPEFRDKLLFVHLNQKMNSREGIAHYRSISEDKTAYCHKLSAISERMANAQNINEFMHWMDEHENIISSVLKIPRVMNQLFPDFQGQIKSLGAWGGDFVLSALDASLEEHKNYFKTKGYQTIICFDDMIPE